MAQKHPLITFGIGALAISAIIFNYRAPKPIIQKKSDEAPAPITQETSNENKQTKSDKKDPVATYRYGQSIVHLAHMLNKHEEYLAEYNKLKDKKQPLNNFIEKLLTEAANQGLIPGCTGLSSDINRRENLLKLFILMLLEEEKEEHSSCGVFYTGYTGSFEFVYDFITIVHSCLDLGTERRERSPFEQPKKIYKNTADFIKDKQVELQGEHPDWGMGEFISSANLYLCAAPKNSGENTINYFIDNTSMDTDWIYTYIDDICKNVGIDKLDKELIEDLLTRYEKLGGRLKQQFIPRELLNRVTYLARAFGPPVGFNGSSNSLNTLKKIKQISGTTEIDAYIDLIRNHPQEISYEASLDGYQARIFTGHKLFNNPRKLKDVGIQTVYYTEKDMTKEQNQLKNELTVLIQERIKKACKEKKLNNIASTWKKTNLETEFFLDKKTKLENFNTDCSNFSKLYNSKLPPKKPSFCRIATYNVHFWEDALEDDSFSKISKVIKKIDPDVLVLQEVALDLGEENRANLPETFKKLGYPNYCFAETVPKMIRQNGFGNAIFSKYPMKILATKIYSHFKEKRAYTHAVITLPNKESLNLFGTHLEVDGEATRFKEINELISAIGEKFENVIIAGDFNAIKQDDYCEEIGATGLWDIVTADYKNYTQMKNAKIPTQVHDHLKKNGFVDCFTYTQKKKPIFTAWNGTTVDFLYLKKKNWKLPIQNCCNYFDAASDHTPVIMDIKL